jgi:hypothetical protein
LPHCFLFAGQLAFRHPWTQKRALFQREHALTPGVLQPLHTFFQIGRFQADRVVCALEAHNEPAAAVCYVLHHTILPTVLRVCLQGTELMSAGVDDGPTPQAIRNRICSPFQILSVLGRA